MFQVLALTALLTPTQDTLPSYEAMPPEEILIDGLIGNLRPASEFATALGEPDSCVARFNELLGETGFYHHFGHMTLVSYDGGASLALDAIDFAPTTTDSTAHYLRFGRHEFRSGTTFEEVVVVFPEGAAAAWALAPHPDQYGGRPRRIVSVGLSRERYTDVRFHFVFVEGLLRCVYYFETC